MYVLERREPFILQNILGNKSQPVYTHRWKEIAIAENKEDLEAIKPKDNPHFQYRIEERFVNCDISK